MLWLGSGVSPQIVDDLYGTDNLQELDVRMVGPRDLQCEG